MVDALGHMPNCILAATLYAARLYALQDEWSFLQQPGCSSDSSDSSDSSESEVWSCSSEDSYDSNSSDVHEGSQDKNQPWSLSKLQTVVSLVSRPHLMTPQKVKRINQFREGLRDIVAGNLKGSRAEKVWTQNLANTKLWPGSISPLGKRRLADLAGQHVHLLVAQCPQRGTTLWDVNGCITSKLIHELCCQVHHHAVVRACIACQLHMCHNTPHASYSCVKQSDLLHQDAAPTRRHCVNVYLHNEVNCIFNHVSGIAVAVRRGGGNIYRLLHPLCEGPNLRRRRQYRRLEVLM